MKKKKAMNVVIVILGFLCIFLIGCIIFVKENNVNNNIDTPINNDKNNVLQEGYGSSESHGEIILTGKIYNNITRIIFYLDDIIVK